MIYVAPIFLITISYMAGSLVQAVFKDKERLIPETCIIGTLFLLLLWEALIMPSIKLLASFSFVCKIYSGLLLGIIILSFVFARKLMLEQLRIRELHSVWPIIGALGIFAIQIMVIFMMMPDTAKDFTVETVNTTLVSDLIYENHPEMGSTFLYGITFRGKLVTLPLFYAYVLQVFGGQAATLVYRVIPGWLLTLNALVYWLWGSELFAHEKKDWNRAFVFVMGIGLLNVFGSFAKNCVFYYQIYRGFRGETFVYGLLLPYSVLLCSRIFAGKKYKSIIYFLMTIWCAVCVTDYQKGVIPIGVAFIICLLVTIGYRIRRWVRCRQ